MPPILGVIADDFTGALETAAMLINSGARCALVTSPEAVTRVGPCDAIVVAQKIRTVEASQAVASAKASYRALKELGASRFFYKYCATFDSTDRGNIGPIAEALLDELGSTFTAYCPSFPEIGRTVYQGHLFVNRQLVSDSPKRLDPLTPMTDPDLVAVLQRQCPSRVGHIGHPQVRSGAAALREEVERLVRLGYAHLITDAIYPEDLQTIAEVSADWPLMTGNSSVAAYLPLAWERRGLFKAASIPPIPAVRGPGAVIAGSCSERTFEQLDAFAASQPVYRIDLAGVSEPEAAVSAALEWSRANVERGPIALTTSSSLGDMVRAQDRFGRTHASRLAEEILKGIAVGLRDAGFRRLLIAGGETSGAVVEGLGIDRLNVAPYTAPGIGRATTAGPDPMALCLKSGKLGATNMFLETLEAMARHGSQT